MSDEHDVQRTMKSSDEPQMRFAGLYDFSPTAYLLLHADGTIRQANLSALTLLGTTRAGIVGRNLVAYLLPARRAMLTDQLSRCRDSCGTGVFDAVLETERSENLSVRIHCAPAPQADGEALFSCALVDLTHEIKAAAAVDDLMREYQVLLDNTFNGVALVRQGRIVRCNAMLERILGYAMGTLAGAPVEALGAETDDPIGIGLPPRFKGVGRQEFERQLRRTDGKTCWCQVSGVDIDPLDSSRGTIWRIQDISARKAEEAALIDSRRRLTQTVELRTAELMRTVATLTQEIERRTQAEKQLRESEQRYRHLVEHATDVWYETDTQGRFIFLNAATAYNILGYTESELMGRSFKEFVHPAWQDQVVQFYSEQFHNRIPSTYLEFPAITKDGREVWFGQYVQLVVENDRIVRHRAYCRDVTDRRKREAELEASRERLRQLSSHLESVREAERSRIAREIHDELGAALTAIKLGLSAIAKAPGAQNEQFPRRKFSGVIQAVDGAIQTVRKIATDLRPSVLDNLGLWAAIEWQCQEMERRLAIPFEIHLGSREPESALDRDRATAVFRIVQEALTNVARHAEATRVTISAEADDSAVRVEISDNGKGMNGSAQGSVKSFGLMGMQERAQFFGGQVHLRSGGNGGTIVLVTVPYGKDAEVPIE